MKKSLIKKLLLCTPVLATLPAIVVPAVQTISKTVKSKIVGGAQADKTTSACSTNNGNISYDLVSSKKHGLNCGDERRYWQYLYWCAADQGSEKSFQQPSWCEDSRLLIKTDGESNNERFIYQQVRINITVPANTVNYKVIFQGEAYESWHWNCHLFGSRYQSAVQMFDLGDDVNAHPDRFNNYAINKNDVDPHSIMEHGWNEVGAGSRDRSDTFTSRQLSWTFDNSSNLPRTFSKYIGVSFWVGGQTGWKNGAVNANVKVGFRTSIDSTGEFKHSLQKWGDIRVECCLTNINQTCYINKYVDGKGTLIIPDHVTFCGRDYYVRRIPNNWSNGENNIRGLKFAPDCRHLWEIDDHAFDGTNALDYYIEHKDELLVFPEGLRRIGCSAFENTDRGFNKIKGYSFPSTLQNICENAFWRSPFISGNNGDGELWFKSNPEIHGNAFNIIDVSAMFNKHKVKYIYAPNVEAAKSIRSQLLESNYYGNCFDVFAQGKGLMQLRVIDKECIVIEKLLGQINVEMCLIDDECLITNYISGNGDLTIPDHITYNGKPYYVKELLTDWSDGSNSISKLEFAPDVSHLKCIQSYAFEHTNCLDDYILFNDKLVCFPEGLEVIGRRAFANTDIGPMNRIRGYSFPKSLKSIGFRAFSSGPYISGVNGNDGELWFRSDVNMDDNCFGTRGIRSHNCKYIYGSTMEIAKKMAKYCKSSRGIMFGDFNTGKDLLIPKVIE